MRLFLNNKSAGIPFFLLNTNKLAVLQNTRKTVFRANPVQFRQPFRLYMRQVRFRANIRRSPA
jgi:hypothetical protein